MTRAGNGVTVTPIGGTIVSQQDDREENRGWWTAGAAPDDGRGTAPATAADDAEHDFPPRAARLITGRSVAPTVELALFVESERPTAFPDEIDEPDETGEIDPWADLPATRAAGLPAQPPRAPAAAPTPNLGLQVTPGDSPAGPTTQRRRRIGALVASTAGVLLAVALVTSFVLRDGAADCRPQPLAAAPAAAVRPLAAPPRAIAAPPIDTAWTSGIITFYGKATTGGACLASSVPANKYTAAAGPQQYAGGAACGTYVDIKGRLGTIRVKITNLCPECPPGHLDLSDEAFAALDTMSKGRVSMQYRAVRNPSVGPLTVQLKDGSNPYWLAIRIDNHGNPLKSVEIASGSQGFQAMQLQDYGYWLDGNGAGNGPFRVRVTDVLGNQATVSGIDLRPMAVQNTGVQLYGAGAGTAPEPAPPQRTPSSPATATSTSTATTGPTTTASKSATATATASASATATSTGTPTPTVTTSAPATASPSEPAPTADDSVPAGSGTTTVPDRC